MEQSGRSFLIAVLVGIAVLAVATWQLQEVIGDSQRKQEEIVKKKNQFHSEFEGVTTLEDLHRAFDAQIARETQVFESYKKSVFFEFPPWVDQVNDLKEHGKKGEYFLKMRISESDRLRVVCGPKCDIDVSPIIGSLGFSSGQAPTDDLALTELRRLAIVAKTIDLAAHAKLEQIQADKNDKIRSTAYLKILTVHPLKPEYTGAVRLDRNPKFKENEHDYKNRRFLVSQYPYFMIEYPIEIRMVCDINTFRRFLASTRQPNQYLIIRNIRIRSDTIKLSLEGHADHPVELSDKDIPDNVSSEMVYIELSAAGVEFIAGHRFQEGVTVPLDLTDYQRGFAPQVKATPNQSGPKPKPRGM